MRLSTDDRPDGPLTGRGSCKARRTGWLARAALAPLVAVLSACDGGSQDLSKQENPRPGEPPAGAQATANPPAATRSEKAPAADAPEVLTSYLYFQYPADPQGGSVDPVTGFPVDRTANPWGVARQFPQARLRLHGTGDDGVSAMLFSDDPREAINRNYTGDSYYFLVKLPEVAGADQIDGARFWFQASAQHREEDSPNGIFLRGDRYRLEPTNAMIQFDGAPPRVKVQVSGQFLQHDNANPKAPAVPVVVQGVLVPRVEAKE